MFIKKFLFTITFISIATIIGIAGYSYFQKPKPALAAGTAWYVDNAATGANNGTSWGNAWQSFAAINWTSVQPGDTIYISGGVTSQTYYETFTFGKSGTAGNKITVKVGQDAGHNGQVIIDGQAPIRNYCFVPANYINISGSGSIAPYGIKCQNAWTRGINGTSGISYVLVEYVEIYNIGDYSSPTLNHAQSHCILANAATGWELSHIYLHQCQEDGINSSGTAFGYSENSLHDSIIDGTCDDGLQAGKSWDVYNNNFRNILPDGSINPVCTSVYVATAAPHPDGIQSNRYYMRIWNNSFKDIKNYVIFFSPTAGQSGEVQGYWVIVNNIAWQTSHSNPPFGSTTSGIVLGANSTVGITNIVIANNTMVDERGTSSGSAIQVGGSTLYNVTNYVVANNIIYNSARIPGLGYAFSEDQLSAKGGYVDYNIISYDSITNHGNSDVKYNGTNMSYSAYLTASSANSHGSNSQPSFVNYSYGGVIQASDLALSVIDTAGLNKGIPITHASIPSIVDTDMPTGWPFDFKGISRPQGSAWDIGAYEYAASTPPPPLKGDFNSDQKVNDLDFTSFKNAFKSIFNSLFDLNSDSVIDVKDLGMLMNSWLP